MSGILLSLFIIFVSSSLSSSSSSTINYYCPLCPRL